MDDQMETARRGQPAGGGVIGNLSVPNHIPETPSVQLLDSALVEIDAARKAARTAGTEAQRHHYRRVVNGLKRRVAEALFGRADESLPMSFLREETDRRRKIETAETVASIYDAAMWGAFKAADYPTWKRWEHFAHEASRARIQAEEIRIGYRG